MNGIPVITLTKPVNPIYQLLFPVSPVAKARPRFTKSGRVYTPAATVNFENQLKWVFKKNKYSIEPFNELLSGPLWVRIVIYLDRPRTSKNKHPHVKPDVDNFSKAILDAMNGLIWHDDAQICELQAVKMYDLATRTPRILLEVMQLT